jgi:asparagine synthase (glutamine-hydrolysing)
MSRIAGLHRPADPRPADDAATVRQMVERFSGAAEILAGPQGAIGRSARAEAAIGGGTAEAAGLSVVVDGRLINADELRAVLPNAGPGDAALVAALVARHGMAGALSYLTGDFAVAVLDPAAGRLWLGRDRFGVKPLYWTQVVGGVAFASQPRALLMLPDVSTEPDQSFVARFAASHYRAFDNHPERSPYRAVRQVPAASILEIGARGAGSPTHY